MKKPKTIILITIGIAILILILLKIFVWGFAPRLNKPESIAYDPIGNRFLISNTGSGSILAMDQDGKYHKFMHKAFTAPKGLFLKDDMLYVVDPTQIHVVDVSEASIIESYAIEGAVALNDLAITEQGLIYVSDGSANCVFIYDPSTRTQEKVISPLFKNPNGIVYDRPRWQMFVVNFSERSPILSLNVQDKSVSIFMDTVYSNLDGIAIDDLGRIYFSSWTEEMIIEIPQEQNRFIAELKDYKSAADIYYHLPTNELIVPLLRENRIERISLD